MKKYKKLIGGFIVLLILILIIGLNNNDKPEDTIKIGVISSLTGLMVGGDNWGQGFANGFLLAHEEYTKANPNKKVEIIIEDDGYDSKKGISAYQKLISVDKVNSIVNLSSLTIDVTKDLLIKEDIPVIQVFAESEILEDNIYQIYPDQTAIGILGQVANQDGAKKVLIAHPQIKAYSKFISDFDSKYEGELIIESFNPTDKNMSSVALKIKEINPDALVVFMGPVEGSQLVKELKNLNYKPKNAYFDISLQFGLSDYTNALGSLEFMNGFKGLYLMTSNSKEFEAKYEKRFGEKASPVTGLGYDSYMAMVTNYDVDTAKWRKNMNSYKIMGASGEISFSPEGLRPPKWSIASIENGELIVK